METAHDVCSLGGHLLRVWDWGEDVLRERFFRSEALAFPRGPSAECALTAQPMPANPTHLGQRKWIGRGAHW